MFFSIKNRPRGEVIIIVAVAVLMAVILCQAWVSEDAYITFRVVDNFTHGYGLRWNTNERVQGYTNPLWMFLHIPFYAVWENIFYITILLSLACSFGAIWITLKTFKGGWPQAFTFFLLPLILATSFTKHSTAGLENSLSHLLFALFCWLLLRYREERFWFWISFVCALNLVNRLDTGAFYAPIILCLVADQFRSIRWRQCFLGSLPIVLWEGFSLFYYGFLFPNTKYAKLGAGIPESEYLLHGWTYMLNLLATDIISAVFLFAAVIVLPAYVLFFRRKQLLWPREVRYVALGTLCYTLYVICVGGNHVSGRFWTLSIFASAWLVYAAAHAKAGNKLCLYFASALLALEIVYPQPKEMQKICPPCFEMIQATGIGLGFWKHITQNTYLPQVTRDGPFDIDVGHTYIGIAGFTDGPNTILIDYLALCDALLARLPTYFTHIDRIGHLPRNIPPGYEYALETGSTEQMPVGLRAYYSQLRLIISGDLFDPKRIDAIFSLPSEAPSNW